MRARLIVRKGGVPAPLKANHGYLWGYIHLTRLVDKAIREYSAAREASRRHGEQIAEDWSTYTLEEHAGRPPYLLWASDHLESCVDATHRAVEAAKELRAAGVGTQAPQPNPESARRVSEIRHAAQHADKRLINPSGLRSDRRAFGPEDPYGISPGKHQLVIGAEEPLSYAELVALIENCYRTAELIGDRVALSYLLR